MTRIEQAAGPVAIVLLQRLEGRRHAAKALGQQGPARIVRRQVGQRLGQGGEHPAIAARPEILAAVGRLVPGVDVLGVAVVQAGIRVVHQLVRIREVFVQLVEVAPVTRGLVQLRHRRHHHIDAVGPPPVIAVGSAHLVFHDLACARDTARVLAAIEFVQVDIGLEAGLPVAEQHVFLGLAIAVLPLGPVVGIRAAPAVMLGPGGRVIAVRLVAGEGIGRHIAGVVGGDVPERPLLRGVVALPVIVGAGQVGQDVGPCRRLAARAGAAAGESDQRSQGKLEVESSRHIVFHSM